MPPPGEPWGDQRAFFESAEKPNIPDGVPLELQVMELRNTVGL
jgi:hypothetical protein